MAWQDNVVQSDSRVYMWEILVPTEKRVKEPRVPGDTFENTVDPNLKNFYTTRYHRVWDAKVRSITGGLTILTPAKGQWVSPDGELFSERMIPVRIMGTRAQIDQIIDFTLKYYDQLAVFCAKVSDEVIVRHRVSV